MSRTLYVQPFNGIAGDMFLGALVDAGAGLAEIERGLDGLDVDGWKIDITKVERHGLVATNLRVITDEGHVHRTAADIRRLVVCQLIEKRAEETVEVVRPHDHSDGAMENRNRAPGCEHRLQRLVRIHEDKEKAGC